MADNIKFVVDVKKLQRDIQKQTDIEAKNAIKSLRKDDLEEIGNNVIAEMKLLISKGISPIKEFGRFPAYKWASAKSLARKSGSKKKTVDRQFQNKYPFSARRKFPNKRERPVNLKLSGSFLENLITKITRNTIYIGFFKEPYTKYEQGHREGANTQPPRPIIPQPGEQFSESIYRRLVKSTQAVFDRKNRT